MVTTTAFCAAGIPEAGLTTAVILRDLEYAVLSFHWTGIIAYCRSLGASILVQLLYLCFQLYILHIFDIQKVLRVFGMLCQCQINV